MENNGNESEEYSSGGLEDVPEVTAKEKMVKYSTRSAAALQLPNMALSFVALGLPMAAVPAVAGAGACYMAPLADANENEITDIKSLEESQEKLTQAIAEYEEQNERLTKEIVKLEKITEGMEQTQNALDTITKQQTQSIDDFEEQVEEQKELLRELEEDSKSGLLQNILTVIVNCDDDGDFKIDPEEIDPLIQGFQDLGLRVNKPKFTELILSKDGDFQAILDLCKTIMKDDGAGDCERIVWQEEK